MSKEFEISYILAVIHLIKNKCVLIDIIELIPPKIRYNSIKISNIVIVAVFENLI